MGAVLVRVVSSGSGKKAKMRVGYCGLGKLGLPCALASEAAGHEVVGYDPNPAVAEYIRTKQIPYREEGTPELLQNTKIRVVSVQEMVDFADLIFVAVQTPHNPRYEGVTRIPEDRVDFDYTYLIEACKQLNEAIEKNGKDKPVVVISTVLPGTMDSKVIPHLGKHFKLCYNPFFIAMGTTRYDFTHPEFVLFGMSDEKTADLAEAFYKTIHNAPFYRCSIKSAELVKVAYNCYSEDTEVLTSGGWKLFPNVAEKDEILSLNPDTLVPEWVKPDKIVGRYHQGPMIRFQSRKDDVFVTPGHNMFIGTLSSKPANGKSYSYEWKLEKANEVIKRKSFAFLRHTNWDLKSPETVNLGFGEVPIELMTEFMAWYLAEGCTTKVSENSYQIIISQNRSKNLEKYNSIVQTVAALQAALGSSNGICQQESGVTFYHAELGEYLCQFGKSFDKYVPSWLKKLGRPEIRLFLDVYNQADGSKQARTRFNGEPTGEFDRYYATSSEQMAADIGELIIKAGHFPSYRAYESELSNKPCNLIYELTGRTSLFQRSSKVGLKYEEVPEYEGMIYCAVLPKNHVFLTRRNGKCSWQGNTFISTKIAFVNNLMEICHHTGADVDEVTSALKLGKERLISTKYLNAGMGDGGGCTLENCNVFTELGVRQTKDIQKGDMVLSSDGQFHKVLETYRRPYHSQLVNVHVKGLPAMKFTLDHTFLVAELEDKTKVTTVKEVKGWELEPNRHHILFPFEAHNQDFAMPKHATEDYLKVAGYYLAEGSIANEPRVAFSFHSNETELHTDLTKSLKRLYPSKRVSAKKHNKRNGLDIRISSADLKRKLLNDFGRGSSKKTIPPWLLFAKPEVLTPLVQSMWAGDGCNMKNGKGLSYTTTSEVLASNLYFILRKFGIVPTITVEKKNSNDGCNRKPQWKVRVENDQYVQKLCTLLGEQNHKPAIAQFIQREIPVIDGVSYHQVVKVELEDYKGTVYNLNVEGTHNYLTTSGISNNCHPRDNIALSWLSRKLGMTFDFHEAIMMAREKQTDFLANLVEKYRKVGIYSAEDFTVKEYRTLPVVILGKAFKEQTNLEVGSPAILLKNILAERGIEAEMYDPWVDKAEDKTVNPYANGPAKCFFIGTHHAVFRDYKFPAGSVVIDPWRMIPEQPGVFVFGVGKGHSSALAFGGFSEAPAKP